MGGFCDQILLYGCRVHTMEGHLPVPSEAVLIEGERVRAVGQRSDLEAMCLPGSRKMDLHGAAVYPGFEDCHIHLASWCLRQTEIDLFLAMTLDDALSIMKDRAGEYAPGEWVLGGGWDKNVWEGFPTASALDVVFPRNPVILGSKDGHSVWVNSLALEKAGVTKDTVGPSGGAVLRSADGTPTGILQDKALSLVYGVVPPVDPDAVVAALSSGLKKLVAMGVTSVHVAEGPDTLRALQVLREREDLPLRITMMVPVDRLSSVAAAGLGYRFGDEWLKLGPVKMFKDGSLGASTAYMYESYEDRPGYTGLEIMTPEETDRAVRDSVAAGFPVACHAIGDRACRETLDSIEKAGVPKTARARHRIEHAEILLPDDFSRFRRHGVVASVQPGHATADRYAADAQWGKRARYAYAFRSLLEAGAVLAFGSDAPVEVPDPLLGIYSAVYRKRPSEPESRPWYPEECLSMFNAILGYTRGAAYAAGDDHLRGTITPGKLADMVILSGDLFDTPEAEVMGLRVQGVIVGGKFVLAEESF